MVFSSIEPRRPPARTLGRRGPFLLVPILLVAHTARSPADSLAAPANGIEASPRVMRIVDQGLRSSATFRALLERLVATQAIEISVSVRATSATASAYGELEVVRWADPLDPAAACVGRVRGRIVIPASARKRQVALLGHELMHVYRLLHGSRSEGRGSAGEREARRVERVIAAELGSPRPGHLPRLEPPELCSGARPVRVAPGVARSGSPGSRPAASGGPPEPSCCARTSRDGERDGPSDR